MPGSRLILGKGDAPLRLDRLEAEHAVGPAAGKNDADRSLFLHLGQRAEQMIDGHVHATYCRTRSQAEMAVIQGQVGVGRDHIDVVDLYLFPIRGLLNH